MNNICTSRHSINVYRNEWLHSIILPSESSNTRHSLKLKFQFVILYPQRFYAKPLYLQKWNLGIYLETFIIPFFTHKKNNKMSSLFYRHCMKNELKKQIKFTHITHIGFCIVKVRHKISHLSMVQLEFLWTSSISDNNLTLIYRISSQKIVWRCKTWKWNEWKVEEKMQLF